MTLESLGGKAANLVWLREAGFPVPAFTVLETDEYRRFVADHGLQDAIDQALTRPDAEASEIIRAAFRRPPSDDQRRRIVAALSELGDVPVAVRSSATAEDLPDASFAGQQDTFLGVRGLDAVVTAVVECWSSLWTERAISYRRRAHIPTDSVALAVVIQRMVDADASGVLFTADPLTGHRGHTSVDAVFGLGEQLVSGQVIPDHYLVETATGTLLERTLTTATPTLTDAQLAELVRLGTRIADRAGSPQDIEWVRVGDDVQIVQSRAVTSLYPLPAGPKDALWISFGAAQGMLEPITPLGSDALRLLLAGAARVFGRTVDYRTNPFIASAGQRLWIRLDRVLAHPLGARVAPRALRGADPNAGAIAGRLVAERAASENPGPLSPGAALRTLGPALRGIVPLLPRLTGLARHPERLRERLDHDTAGFLADVHRRLTEAGTASTPAGRLAARLDVLDWSATRAFPILLPDFAPIMGPALAFTLRLRRLAAKTGLPDADTVALRILRSLPGNVTTEMDLALWDAAQRLRPDAAARDRVLTTPPAELAERFTAGTLPAPIQDAVAGFLRRYGMRGVAEIDLGAPRWSDDPTGVFASLASYLTLDADAGPDAQYAEGARAAERAIDTLAAASSPRDAAQIRFAASRVRATFGARETPKFTLVRLLGQVRTALLASGADLVAAGRLDAPDDVLFLHLDELRAAFAGPDLRPRVAERRAVRAREQRRTRVPVVLAGDGRTFYDGGLADPTTTADLTGMGVSPGVIEAAVRVVHDPRTSALQPGEILVCRGTDPAWTPLFLTASGLVTEVGGLMTHGSVVAREYGLPAVVGVADATTRLTDGRRVRLDGTAGTIEFLDADPSPEAR